MIVKMSYVVALYRRRILNSKPKHFLAIWPLAYEIRLDRVVMESARVEDKTVLVAVASCPSVSRNLIRFKVLILANGEPIFVLLNF